VARAYTDGGVPAFGAALYGPSWDRSMGPADDEAVGRDLMMFREFEPVLPTVAVEHVVTTAGELSAPLRHQVGRALRDSLGLGFTVLSGAGHGVHLDAPSLLAVHVHRLLDRVGR
jgi:hypothetical protein